MSDGANEENKARVLSGADGLFVSGLIRSATLVAIPVPVGFMLSLLDRSEGWDTIVVLFS